MLVVRSFINISIVVMQCCIYLILFAVFDLRTVSLFEDSPSEPMENHRKAKG